MSAGSGVRIGVLALQGDVSENVASVSAALKSPRGFDDDSITLVKRRQHVENLDGLVIPGGESTAIGKLADAAGMLDVLRTRIQDERMPVLGICAGLIMLAKSADDRVVGGMDAKQPLLGMLDVDVQRNAFGRQSQSFEIKLDIKPLSISGFRGVFIRAPVITRVADDVRVLCELEPAGLAAADGNAANADVQDVAPAAGTRRIVAVAKDNIIGTAFHPELSKDLALHKHFVDVTRRHKRG